MYDWTEGDLCIRCNETPIFDARLPYCSECRKKLEDETARRIADRKNTIGKKRIKMKIGTLKHKFR
jgi:hypothetical protein